MSILMTRSKVKAEQVAEVEAGLVPALQQARLENMGYAWFRLGDGVTYVVMVEYEEGKAIQRPAYQNIRHLWRFSRPQLTNRQPPNSR